MPPAQAPGTNAWLYADQGIVSPGRTTPDTFFLMYDECGTTSPLGPDQYFLISFDSVEPTNGHDGLHRYNIHVFSDGTIIESENGVVQTDSQGNSRVTTIDNQRGKAGFGVSPKCNFPHLIVEYQIDLTQAGGDSYSPDPLFWGGTDPPCSVSITPVAPPGDADPSEELADMARGTMNVAEHAAFTATVSGGSGTPSFQWQVDGTTYQDYTDKSDVGFSLGGPPDLTQPTISYYWGAETGTRNVQVTVTVGSQTCQESLPFTVERNTTDPKRQAEHWWTSNHNSEVLNEHDMWHMRNSSSAPLCGVGQIPVQSPAECYGATFFMFHKAYLKAFSDFRAAFGYPPIGPAYDPSTPIPADIPAPDPGRNNNPTCHTNGFTLPSCATPTEFTTTGTTAHTPLGRGCDVALTPEPKKLQDWPADQNALACALTNPFHNAVHMSIGGDMADTATAPKDPVFWRWHTFVEGISEQRSGFTPALATLIYPSPTYLFVTSLPHISITYDKSVTGVVAADLVVNGQPATAVTGSGAGPYVFTGWAAPPLGSVSVKLLPGSIVAANGDGAQGETFGYQLLDPSVMVAGDTLTVGQKIALSLDPTRPDTGMDGLPDGYMLSHPCTAALAAVDVDAPMAMDDTTVLPPILDARGDSFHDDFRLGTDPCATSGVSGLNAIRSGFNTAILPGNDDGSTGAVALPFSPNFFGTTYSQLFVNNNGNVTFDGPLSEFTPFDLNSTNHVIIAPFFADVDTTQGNVLTYGNGFVNGHPAFGVTWPGVGCFSGNDRVLDDFQVVLIDRSDTGPGNFDIEFNYDKIQWEAGQASGGDSNCLGGSTARAGFSQGTGNPGTSFELPGSGIPGSFLDTNPTGLIHSDLNSDQLGRYVFPVRNGQVNTTVDSDGDGVPDDLDNCPHTPNANQLDSNLNGIGDACEAAVHVHSTAAFLEANLDGTTSAQPVDPVIADEPNILLRIQKIVAFRIANHLATDAATETADLLSSAAALGLIQLAPTTTTITASPTSPLFGAPVTFTAVVAPSTPNPATPTGTVTFFVDGMAAPVAQQTLSATGTVSFTATGLGAGSHTVEAEYSGDTVFLPSAATTPTLTVGCTTTITGRHPTAIVLSSGSLCLLHAQVGGSVTVLSAAALDSESSTITGALTAGSPAAVRVCSTSIGGTLSVDSALGLVLVGGSSLDNCPPNVVTGSLVFSNNSHGLEAIGNHVGGRTIASGNAGPGAYPDDNSPIVSDGP